VNERPCVELVALRYMQKIIMRGSLDYAKWRENPD